VLPITSDRQRGEEGTKLRGREAKGALSKEKGGGGVSRFPGIYKAAFVIERNAAGTQGRESRELSKTSGIDCHLAEKRKEPEPLDPCNGPEAPSPLSIGGGKGKKSENRPLRALKTALRGIRAMVLSSRNGSWEGSW